MKKIVILIAILIFGSCEFDIKFNEAKALNSKEITCNSKLYCMNTFVREQMTYVVYSWEYGGTAIVNITKDKLEVEKLRLEIKRLNNGK